jgi:hypothetical protein
MIFGGHRFLLLRSGLLIWRQVVVNIYLIFFVG